VVEFLKDLDNKQELFTFLSDKVATAQFNDGKVMSLHEAKMFSSEE
jgi:hypothetical protein